MTFTSFADAVGIMLKALPCPQQDKRAEALFEFFGQRDERRIAEAARLAAKEAERFPTPALFEEYYRRTGRAQRGHDSATWRDSSPPTSDVELAEKIPAMNPQKLYAGCVALGHAASPLPFLRRLYAMTREILGEDEAKRIETRVARSTLDVRLVAQR